MPVRPGLRLDLSCAAASSQSVGDLRALLHGTTMTPSLQTLLQDLDLRQAPCIGRGSSGAVRRVVGPNGTPIALKEIKTTSQSHQEEIRMEMKVAQELSTGNYSAFLVEYYGAYVHEGSVFIAMECMDGCLANLGRVPPLIIARMARGIIRGLMDLHVKCHLIHRDVKPGNILYRLDGQIKISDFGISSHVDGTQGSANTFVGTVTYMSPERLMGERYSYSSDVWSVGIVVAELALGHHPFYHLIAGGSSTEARFWSLVSHLKSDEADTVPMPADADPLLVDFVRRCVLKSPDERWTTAALLQHPFLEQLAMEDDAQCCHQIGEWLATCPHDGVSSNSTRPTITQSTTDTRQDTSDESDTSSFLASGKESFDLDDALSRLVDVQR